jgi:ketosteroid isomerase-like protein
MNAAYTQHDPRAGRPGGGRQDAPYATIWQRDADGRWRLAVDSSSPNP